MEVWLFSETAANSVKYYFQAWYFQPRAPHKFKAVHAGHYDIGDQQLEITIGGIR